jgi:hypothetical protein
MDGICKGCPNCGHDLVIERNVAQPAGSRSVRLCWLICSHCRHVALGEWEFVETSGIQCSPHRRITHRD